MRTVVFLFAALFGGLFSGTALAHHGLWHHSDRDCRDCYGGDCRWRGSTAARGRGAVAAPSANLRTVDGKVSEIVYLPGVDAGGGMVEAWVAGAAGPVLVRLAPAGILKQKQLALREGDSVAVTGYMVSGMEDDILVVTEIRKGGQTISLRDVRGRLIR